MAKQNQKLNKDYDVGYQKPPKAHQFAKGHSGNPKGRPKGSSNWANTLKKALEEKVTINEKGRQRLVTKFEAATMQLANKAAAGDTFAILNLLKIMPSVEAIVNKVSLTALSGVQDKIVLGQLLKNLQAPAVEVVRPDLHKENDEVL